MSKKAKPTAQKRPRPLVGLVPPSYQPSRAELQEDLRVDATFAKAVQAVVQPATVRYRDPARTQPKNRSGRPASASRDASR